MISHLVMPSQEKEMSLTIWHDLLGRQLTIALEELSEIHKDGANKRHQHYVESCAQQYWKIIARITRTIGKRRPDWIPLDFNGQRTGKVSSIRTIGERTNEIGELRMVPLHS